VERKLTFGKPDSCRADAGLGSCGGESLDPFRSWRCVIGCSTVRGHAGTGTWCAGCRQGCGNPAPTRSPWESADAGQRRRRYVAHADDAPLEIIGRLARLG
jgi:hypothetical protein